MGEKVQKRPFSTDFLSKACPRFKGIDTFHEDLEILYDLKEKILKNQQKIGRCP